MRIEIMDGETVIQTILADEAFAESAYPGAWRVADVQDDAPTPQGIQTISRAQGKAALIQAGMWAGVVAYVAAIEDDTERALAEVALNDTQEWKRNSPFLTTAAAALGLDDAALDALFLMASGIEL